MLLDVSALASFKTPMPDALSWLRTHGNQRRLCKFVEATTGRKLHQPNVSRWASGKTSLPPVAEALVLMLAEQDACTPDEEGKNIA